MLAPLRHADHVEQCPSSEAKRKNLLSLRLSQFDRCCRKSRKSNDAKNLANVDFWTTPPLRCSLVSIRRSVGRFSEKRCGPSRRCARNASAALENFVCYPQKTFSTASTQS